MMNPQTDQREALSRQNLIFLLKKAAEIRNRMGDVMAPYGVTGQQYNVLRILAGAHPEPLAVLEIAARLIERTPGITRFIDQLEEKGYLVRVRDAVDRRRVFCSISAEGETLVKSMNDDVEAANLACFEELTEEELTVLHRLLSKVTENNERGDGI